MEQTTVTYQCPNCGAALSFDAEKQNGPMGVYTYKQYFANAKN